MHARNEEFEVVHVNDLTDDPTLEYLLQYDSVHGRFAGKIDPGEPVGEFFVDGRRVHVTSTRLLAEAVAETELELLSEAESVALAPALAPSLLAGS